MKFNIACPETGKQKMIEIDVSERWLSGMSRLGTCVAAVILRH